MLLKCVLLIGENPVVTWQNAFLSGVWNTISGPRVFLTWLFTFWF